MDVRVWVGFAVALGVFAVLSAASTTRPVVVATRDLPAGSVLRPSDLTVSRALLDRNVYAAAVPGRELSTLVGKQIADPLHRGQVASHGRRCRTSP